MATINSKFTITFADGKQTDVQTTLEDRLAFEQTLRKNKRWGKLEDNTLKMQPFLAWNAAKRTGVTDLSWDDFTTGSTAALDVSVADDADDDADLEVAGVGKDTQTAASTSSASSSPETTEERPGSGAAKKPRK